MILASLLVDQQKSTCETITVDKLQQPLSLSCKIIKAICWQANKELYLLTVVLSKTVQVKKYFMSK